MKEAPRWLRGGLLFVPGAVSVVGSLVHLHVHDPTFLTSVSGQVFPLVASLCFVVGAVWASTEAETEAELYRIGLYLAGVWLFAGIAGFLYASHQYVTPLIEMPPESVVFQTNFFALLGGSLGLVVGVDSIRQDRILDRYREQRDRFQLLFANVETPVAEYQSDGDGFVIHEANDAFERRFGVEPPLTAATLEERIVPEDRRDGGRELDALRQASDETEIEVLRETVEGRRWFSVRTASGHEKRGFVIYTDITDRRIRTQQIQVLDRMLRHNLRNQMNVVDGYAELLATELGDDQLVGYAERIGAVASSLTTTAETVRFVRNRLENDPPKPEPLDVTAIVERCLRRARDTYPKAEFHSELPDSAVAYAHDTMGIVLDALFENAVEHNDAETPRIDVHITERTGSELAISVEDNGPGMPDSELVALESGVEPTQLEHATGIDLWMANWFVTEFGGSTAVPENGAQGTVVELHLTRPERPVPDGRATVETS